MKRGRHEKHQSKLSQVKLFGYTILYAIGLLCNKMRKDVRFVVGGICVATFMVVCIGLSINDALNEDGTVPLDVVVGKNKTSDVTINNDGFLGMEFEHADAASDDGNDTEENEEAIKMSSDDNNYVAPQLPSRGGVVHATQIPIEAKAAEAVNEPVVEETPELVIADENTNTDGLEYLGTFTITHYCCENYPHICNDGDATTTASGEPPVPFETCAVDTNQIPLLSTIVINGKEYRCNDRGGAIKGNRIDLCVDTHQHALDLGKYDAEVYIKR